MTFIRSISGFRGTIGGPKQGNNLTPPDMWSDAAQWATEAGFSRVQLCVPPSIGTRPVRREWAVTPGLRETWCTGWSRGTLMGMGIDVLDLGLSTTPTVEMAVMGENADGGIILTASHNPVQWNALKLLDGQGAFISAEAGAEVIRRSSPAPLAFAPVEDLGQVTRHR